MPADLTSLDQIGEGFFSFRIESRILRELGERLVKQPEVALLELVKNSYDADATVCKISANEAESEISISDDGYGMTRDEFKFGWMTIGSSAKAKKQSSRKFVRTITGEKGIGRFAVRFLGKELEIESIAYDKELRVYTVLTAYFNWPKFDRDEDLGEIKVPYQLHSLGKRANSGTRLVIRDLHQSCDEINFSAVRTGSLGVVTPYHSLMRKIPKRRRTTKAQSDPGFNVVIDPAPEGSSSDTANAVLENYVIRASLTLAENRVLLEVFAKDQKKPVLSISDSYRSSIETMYADIRFFPDRKGTFTNLPVNGRRAKAWMKDHSGVAVFDRSFRVHPYGLERDDWLLLLFDNARRARNPRSSIAQRHFTMDEAVRKSTQTNYMLKLPTPNQLIGLVQVEGQRSTDPTKGGLIASADREGFVENVAFDELVDLVRGAVEAIASCDRDLQLKAEEKERRRTIARVRKETKEAIREIESNANIESSEKVRIIDRLLKTGELVEQHEEATLQRESVLQTMSLLGVVAGFMTHEFGTAFDDLRRAQKIISSLSKKHVELAETATSISGHIENLREFVAYSQGYIQAADNAPQKTYPAKPRIKQVQRIFGTYASDRRIAVEIEIESGVKAPRIPVSLYNGIALNLFTNALKAVTAKSGKGRRRIAFRAWNEVGSHFLEVSDTGIGIPHGLTDTIFEPLVTTTKSNKDPLGSGMGLGLSLVRRGVEAWGGEIKIIDPPPDFITCVHVRIPLEQAT